MNMTTVPTPDEIAMLHRERLITHQEARRLLAHYGITDAPATEDGESET